MPGLLRGVARTAVIAGTATDLKNQGILTKEGFAAQKARILGS